MDKIFERNKETLCHFYKFFLFLQYLVRVSMKRVLHVGGSQCESCDLLLRSFISGQNMIDYN